MIRKLLFSSLSLAPLTLFAEREGLNETHLFIFAALALIPLAWLIGETTEHASHHTGPRIAGFLNAAFGNAPELIIAYFAVRSGLMEVVRGSMSGSIISNLLLVLGFSMLAGGKGKIDRRSALTSLALIAVAILFFLPASVLGAHGDPDRASLAFVSLALSVVLLVVYVAVTWRSLRNHYRSHISDDPPTIEAWSLKVSLLVLAAVTIMTTFVAEALVNTLKHFAERAHMTEFFVAAVIVAIVGNAAEHGGAVIVAARRKMQLAAEIALSSGAQVAVFLIPAVAVISWTVNPLSLAFRQAEVFAMGLSILLLALLFKTEESSRIKGAVLVGTYFILAAAFYFLPDRVV